MHQSHHLNGCQPIRINSPSIFAFWVLRFWSSSYHSIISSSFQWSSPSSHILICCCVTNQSGTNLTAYWLQSTALLHISYVLNWYLWLPHKTIGDIYQGGRVVPHCDITHLYFEMVRDIAQVWWICLSCFKTHFLHFKTVRNMVKCSWHGTHYLLRFKMLKKRHIWSVAHCLLTRLLRFKMIREYANASLHISCLLRRWGTTFIHLVIFIYIFSPDEVQGLWIEKIIEENFP